MRISYINASAPPVDNPPASSAHEREIIEMIRDMDLGQKKQEEKKYTYFL